MDQWTHRPTDKPTDGQTLLKRCNRPIYKRDQLKAKKQFLSFELVSFLFTVLFFCFFYGLFYPHFTCENIFVLVILFKGFEQTSGLFTIPESVETCKCEKLANL